MLGHGVHEWRLDVVVAVLLVLLLLLLLLSGSMAIGLVGDDERAKRQTASGNFVEEMMYIQSIHHVIAFDRATASHCHLISEGFAR